MSRPRAGRGSGSSVGRKIGTLGAAVALFAGVTVVIAQPAKAATVSTSTTYQLVSRYSGKAIAVQGNSTADLAGIVQSTPDTSNTSQQWTFVSSGSGYYRLRSVRSGKVIDVSGRSTADGAAVIQYADNDAVNQQFSLEDSDSGYVRFVNRNSGKVLDDYGRSTAEGAAVSQYTDQNGTNQQWQLVSVGSGGGGTTPPPTTTPPSGGKGKNPALPGYTADPTIRYFAGQYWIYPTTDGIDNWGATSFHAYSSPNMVSWTDHGVVLNLANVSWCHQMAWAPNVVYKNGSYWFYFSACQQIGVAKGSSPGGPFTDALGHALISTNKYGEQEIDPSVMTDDDGTSYLYFGSGKAEVAKLSSSMTALATAPTRITPGGFREASDAFKRNGTYYLMYSQNDTRSADYQVDYATSKSPLGPFTEASGSPVLSKNTSLGILGTGSSSVIQIPGKDEWFIAYHRFKIPGGDGTHREVCIDKLTFSSSGAINKVVPTLTGVGPVS